ncbi:Bug family tripartite tricarboxylate transporter substrate binding protein [Caenimonas terrae]|uniref:Bug family tripartite tricarboxylate transporter substrate binding protein n=1 Tax=Caenimonas terrae TaxID=696074 RepID=A0ABW0ND87_9BURK
MRLQTTSRRRALGTLAAGALALAGGRAGAQDDKSPIRMLCGISAGSGNDFTARLVAEKMREVLGRPVIVENRPGAGQRIALNELRRSPPDGRTLMLCTTGPFTIYPHIYARLDYDPVRDFTPIASVASFDVGIATGPQMKARTMQELIALARADKSFAAFGSPGNGSLSHFVGISMGLATGIELTHVPYKDSGVSALDLASGRLPMLVTGVSQMVELHRAGKIRILAVSGGKRSSQLPDVPTLRECGINVSNTTTCGVYGPAGMAPELVRRFSAAAQLAVQGPGPRERLARYLFEPAPAGAQELAALMADESRDFARLVKASGYSPE